jgi:hypothetical protein
MATYKLIEGNIGTVYKDIKRTKIYSPDFSTCIDIKKATFEEYFSNIEKLDKSNSISWIEGFVIKNWELTPISFIIVCKKVWGKSSRTNSSRTMVEFTDFRVITKKL